MNTGSREIYTELFDKERITEEEIGRKGKEESIGICKKIKRGWT